MAEKHRVVLTHASTEAILDQPRAAKPHTQDGTQARYTGPPSGPQMHEWAQPELKRPASSQPSDSWTYECQVFQTIEFWGNGLLSQVTVQNVVVY